MSSTIVSTSKHVRAVRRNARMAAVLVIFCVASLLAVGLTLHAADNADTAALLLMKRTEVKVRNILTKPTKSGTPRHEAKKQALRTVINQLFDFQELSKRALNEHWNLIGAAKQKEFSATLQALIEKNYLLRISDHTTYQALFVNYACKDDTASTVVKVRSGAYEFQFTFVMHKTGSVWTVYDMVIDDVSLVENYRTQFNSIIKKKGIDELLKKMKEKLAE